MKVGQGADGLSRVGNRLTYVRGFCAQRSGRYIPVYSLLGSVLFLSAALAGIAAASERDMPWALRDHYEYGVGEAKLMHAAANGEWGVEVAGQGMVLDKVGAAVHFTDGTQVLLTDGTKTGTDRTTVDSALGKATRFSVELSHKRGLALTQAVTVIKNYPFVIVEVEVRNTGTEPLKISRINSAVIGPGCMDDWSMASESNVRRLTMRGGYPIFDTRASSLVAFFSDPDRGFALGLGLLPHGKATSGLWFAPDGDAWQGEAASVFSPPVEVAPGASLAADPVWVSFGTRQPARMDLYYAWAFSKLVAPPAVESVPETWVSARAGASAEELYAAARAWAGSGVQGVLVPRGWEGRPGSLQGAAPAYPREMRKVASEIQILGMTPGLSVDPLAAEGGKAGWVAKGPDGQSWVNLSSSEAREHVLGRLKKLVDWGFRFFVVESSQIPDPVLQEFQMTRQEADTLAFKLMAAASGGLPVLPASAATMDGRLEPWLEAASCTSRMKGYGLTTAPVSLDLDRTKGIDPNLPIVWRFFGGPIELLGKPKASHREALKQFPPARLAGRPLDTFRRAPHIWQISVHGEDGACRGNSVIAFPGAAEWGMSDLEIDGDALTRIWRVNKGQFEDLGQGPVPMTDTLAVFGVSPILSCPSLLGANTGLALLLDNLNTITWDEQKARLYGSFRGKSQQSHTLFFAVPKPWTLRSAQWEGCRLRTKEGDQLCSMDIAAGSPGDFELVFERN